MQDIILYQKNGPVVTLTLNRPVELNAFSEPDMIDAFLGAIARIKADADVRAVVLTGAGRAFSAGGNVKHMRDKSDMFAGSADDIAQAYRDGILRVPPIFYNLEIPIIAAINGPTFGAALDLICMCDIRLASPSATFGAPFVKIGIAPGDGAAWFLPKIIGQANAAEMLFTGDTIDANRALEMGLIGRIVAQADLLSEAQTIAEKIAANAPLAVRETKKLLREGQYTRLDPHLDACAKAQGMLHSTDDHMEAINAFFEKQVGVYNRK